MIAMIIDAFVKTTVLLVLAAGATWALRRSAAALRHLVWALACGGVLALPLASALLPMWRLNLWPRLDVPVSLHVNQIAGDPLPTLPPSRAPEQPAPAVSQSGAEIAHAPVAPDPIRVRLRPDWTMLVVPLWLSGFIGIMMLLGIGLLRVVWLGRTTGPAAREDWLFLEQLSRELGVRRPVRLLQASGPAMPMTWGIRRPVILLPADAGEWPAERRRDVLLHELAHVKRHDFLVQLIARVACAIYWFHPLVWLAAARLRVERERACDDQVLCAGVKPSTYAGHLLEIARALRPAAATSLASVAMARPAQLATRLLDVLDARRCRDTVSARAAAPAWIAALLLVVPLAAAAPRLAEPQRATLATAKPVAARVARSASPHVNPIASNQVPPAATPVVESQSDTLRGCGVDGSRRSTHSHEGDGDVITLSTTMGHCVINFDADGKFVFSDDFTDIATVAPGGRVVVEVDYGAHDRRVTIQRAGNGVERIYKVDGDVRPFDDEAKAWLTETLTFLLRRTGFMAEERARWILERRGIQGLFDEFVELTGDYTRRIYYQAAVESGKLDAAGYERIVTLAGQNISSDYELAEFLITVSKAQPLTERMQAGFVTAAKSISSDYERHRVLAAALSRPGLTPAMESAVLDAASDIRSDYELAELLIELNKARPIDDAVRPAFFKAANSLQSDYEHRRVLDAVVSRDGMTSGMIADVLGSARTISSDYELAELLTKVGGSYALDDALRPAFFAAAGTLSSDYEHARALGSVLEHGEVTRPVALAVLESAKGISSDHELSELLLAVIQRVRMDDTVRAAVRADAESISSSYDRGRVFEALARD